MKTFLEGNNYFTLKTIKRLLIKIDKMLDMTNQYTLPFNLALQM